MVMRSRARSRPGTLQPDEAVTDAHDRSQLEALLAQRILVIDGAMGTMIQAEGLSEPDFRGERFQDHPRDLAGDNEVLSLTRPDVVGRIHDAYLEAGADIIETNTFGATRIAQADYGLEGAVEEINLAAAELAVRAAREWTRRTPDRPRFAAGAIGPTNKTLSISPDVNDAAYRDLTFDALCSAYADQARALVRGGVDILLIETIFDTLNAKAAIASCLDVLESEGADLPIMISVTITDRSGPRCDPSWRTWPPSRRCPSPPTRTRACPTPSAATTRSRSPPPPCCGSSPRADSSTSWAAAAVPRTGTSERSPTR
jgi:5-methyltetrahydrofolate--homocysteine methyltransferase